MPQLVALPSKVTSPAAVVALVVVVVVALLEGGLLCACSCLTLEATTRLGALRGLPHLRPSGGSPFFR
jgi:hypothetical protein